MTADDDSRGRATRRKRAGGGGGRRSKEVTSGEEEQHNRTLHALTQARDTKGDGRTVGVAAAATDGAAQKGRRSDWERRKKEQGQ